MSENGNLLGDFLRARRGKVGPADVGLAAGLNRRVAGLRREEVAMLAGISIDYYLRLEQGRDRNPSKAVLNQLAAALRLDAVATEYLLGLTGERRPPARQGASSLGVRSGLQSLIDSLGVPAWIADRRSNVLASNGLAVALSPNLQVDRNRMRALFLDPRERALYADWAGATAHFVAGLRQIIGDEADDPRMAELVADLSRRSPRFRQLWASQKNQPGIGCWTTRLRHPKLGQVTVNFERLPVGGTDGDVLVICWADQGSVSAAKLRTLAYSCAPGSVGAPPRVDPSTR